MVLGEIGSLCAVVCLSNVGTLVPVDRVNERLNVALRSWAVTSGVRCQWLPPVDQPTLLDAWNYVRFIREMLFRRSAIGQVD